MPRFHLPHRVLHARFLTILPRIQLHAKVFFRHIRCWHTKEDRIAETIDLAWKWFIRLAEKGKDARNFPSVLASYAARAVKCGRRLCGQLKAKDVMSERAQQRHCFTVLHLPSTTQASYDNLYSKPGGQLLQDEFEERLQDNVQTPVPDQVQFRIDFAAWLKTLTPRERRIIKAMARNERTKDLSQEFEVSPARISQLRRSFHDSWCQFTDA